MPLQFDSPMLLGVAMTAVIVAAMIAWWRRLALPVSSRWLGALGLLLLALAAGGINWIGPKARSVMVMVDVSPSTEGAEYRSRPLLEQRIKQLVGDRPHQIVLFSDKNYPDNGAAQLPDIPTDRTIFGPPPSATAILLFSDCRFDLPKASPPVYPVIDAALERRPSEIVQRLTVRGHELVAAVQSDLPARLEMKGSAATQPISVRAHMIVSRPIDPHATIGSATLISDQSPLPDNSLSIPLIAPMPSQRWWIGANAPQGWNALSASNLPAESSAYLSPSVIVLNDQPASALSVQQQQRLLQYVRDFGGGLVLLGGPHAFGAGGYRGTPLEALSPLATSPPQPREQWIILVDSSGSMSAGGRWQQACDAVAHLLPHLPAHDPVVLGSFAEQITWWNTGGDFEQLKNLPIPPTNVSPHGPTNLQQAIENVINNSSGSLPKELLLVTDADAQIDQPTDLGAGLKSKSIHLHLLAIGNGVGLAALTQIAQESGGKFVVATGVEHWADELLSLGESAMPAGWQEANMGLRWLAPLQLPDRTLDFWNPTWIKSEAKALGQAAGHDTNPAARWQEGSGQVIGCAFATNVQEAVALADQIAQPPSDPRFAVNWDVGSKLAVSVNAVDGKQFLNDQHLMLRLQNLDGESAAPPIAIPQTGPGRYELTLDAPRTQGFASVAVDGRLLDRTAIPSRYAPEWDALGNDHAAMHALADHTGGKVIDINQTKPIDFRWPEDVLPLGSWLAAIGAILLAAGLVLQRIRPSFDAT